MEVSLKNIVPVFARQALKKRLLKKRIHKFITEKVPFKEGIFEDGINLIGCIKSFSGLGQSCRLLAQMLLETGYKISVYNSENSKVGNRGDESYNEYINEQLIYGINIFHINPCELGWFYMMHQNMWNRRYNIAFWLWELEEFPTEWILYCHLFDEIWVPSTFIKKSIVKVTDVPVKVLPYHVTAPYDVKLRRKEFNLPKEKFLFLIMYDANSTMRRKNPQGAINAFKKAFRPEEENVGLVIKVNHARKRDWILLKNQLEEYRNIYYFSETMEKEVVNSLVHCVDVFVSLHRSEGFGLVMAEAMLLGTPVVATNWSSNIEFMDENSACLVDYELIRNDRTEGLYKKGCIWAEPDIGQATAYMKELRCNKEYFQHIQKNGKRYIELTLGKSLCQNLRCELNKINGHLCN